MKHNDGLRHWQATTLAGYDTGMLRHTHITTTARPYTGRHNKTTKQSKMATDKETRRDEKRVDETGQDGTGRETGRDERRGTHNH